MALQYIGKSSAMGTGNGNITVTVPSGYAAGNLLVMLLQGYNAIPAAPGGWSSLDTQTNTNTNFRVCYKIAGSSESNVSVADSGDSTRGIMLCFADADTVTPIEVSSKSTSTGTSFSATGLTTTTNGCIIVTAIGFFDDDVNDTTNYDSWANASLASITEGHDESTNSGSGGGIAFAYGTDEIAGTVNSTTATADNAANYSATIMFAVKPRYVVKTKVSGTWKTVSIISAKVSGTWRTINAGYKKVSGSWLRIY